MTVIEDILRFSAESFESGGHGRSPGLLPFFRLPKLWPKLLALKTTNPILWLGNSVAGDNEKRFDTKLTVAGTAPDLSLGSHWCSLLRNLAG
jgi:hypothetical protein